MRRRHAGAVAAVVVAVAGTVGGWHATHACGCSTPSFSTSPTANEWVNTSAAGTPVRNSSPAPYDTANHFGTLQAAYNVAQPGDTIKVQCGSYSGFTWVDNGIQGASTTAVTARPATLSGGCLTFTTSVTFTTAKYVTLYGGTTCAQNFPAASDCGIKITAANYTAALYGVSAKHIVVDGVQTPLVDFNGGSDDTVQNSDIGPCDANASQQSCSSRQYPNGNGSSNIATRITFDHNLFHDINTTNAALYHVECVFLRGSSFATVTNNRFWNCQVFDIFVQDNSNVTPTVSNTDWVIQQNWLNKPCNNETCTTRVNTAVNFSDAASGNTNGKFSFNSGCATCSFNQNPAFGSGYIFAANLSQNDGSCTNSAATSYWFVIPFSNNAPFNTSCGSNWTLQGTASGSFDYTSSALDGTFDYRLTSNAVGEANSVPTSVAGGCPATDILGNVRPKGGNANCSAGATEP